MRTAGTGSQACRPPPTLGYISRGARTKCAARKTLCNRVWDSGAVAAGLPASRDQPIDRSVGAAGQAHAPLRDEGGQQLIEQQHDRGIAGEFVRTLALDRLDP